MGKIILVDKILKIVKKYFPNKFGIPRYSKNYNPDLPEIKKFGISVINNRLLVNKILKI